MHRDIDPAGGSAAVARGHQRILRVDVAGGKQRLNLGGENGAVLVLVIHRHVHLGHRRRRGGELVGEDDAGGGGHAVCYGHVPVGGRGAGIACGHQGVVGVDVAGGRQGLHLRGKAAAVLVLIIDRHVYLGHRRRCGGVGVGEDDAGGGGHAVCYGHVPVGGRGAGIACGHQGVVGVDVAGGRQGLHLRGKAAAVLVLIIDRHVYLGHRRRGGRGGDGVNVGEGDAVGEGHAVCDRHVVVGGGGAGISRGHQGVVGVDVAGSGQDLDLGGDDAAVLVPVINRYAHLGHRRRGGCRGDAVAVGEGDGGRRRDAVCDPYVSAGGGGPGISRGHQGVVGGNVGGGGQRLAGGGQDGAVLVLIVDRHFHLGHRGEAALLAGEGNGGGGGIAAVVPDPLLVGGGEGIAGGNHGAVGVHIDGLGHRDHFGVEGVAVLVLVVNGDVAGGGRRNVLFVVEGDGGGGGDAAGHDDVGAAGPVQDIAGGHQAGTGIDGAVGNKGNGVGGQDGALFIAVPHRYIGRGHRRRGGGRRHGGRVGEGDIGGRRHAVCDGDILGSAGYQGIARGNPGGIGVDGAAPEELDGIVGVKHGAVPVHIAHGNGHGGGHGGGRRGGGRRHGGVALEHHRGGAGDAVGHVDLVAGAADDPVAAAEQAGVGVNQAGNGHFTGDLAQKDAVLVHIADRDDGGRRRAEKQLLRPGPGHAVHGEAHGLLEFAHGCPGLGAEDPVDGGGSAEVAQLPQAHLQPPDVFAPVAHGQGGVDLLGGRRRGDGGGRHRHIGRRRRQRVGRQRCHGRIDSGAGGQDKGHIDEQCFQKVHVFISSQSFGAKYFFSRTGCLYQTI